jgi:hypothetical protein
MNTEVATAIVNALRAGTVPSEGLEHLAVGVDDLAGALAEQRAFVATGRGAYKFVRGSYGSGKTFLTSLATSQALEERFVTTRVVLSVTDAPLFRLVEVYRRMCRNMALAGGRSGALQAILDRWLYGLEQQVIEVDGVTEEDDRFGATVARRVRQALAPVGERAGRLASCIEAYHAAQFDQQYAESRGILDWMMGESKVAASLKRSAGVTGQLDNADVMILVRGLLELLRAAGWQGLVVVLDETETTLRLKRPERQKSLEVLRQWIDAIDANEFPGLHLIVTGTPEFFDSPQGVPMLEPLNERIKVAFKDDGFDNLRQPQIRLRPFDRERLISVARKVREIYPGNVAGRMTDRLIERMADGVTKGFGGRIEVVPRGFLREFVHVLDLIDQRSDYDPAADWDFSVDPSDVRPEEEEALHDARREVSF